MAEDLSWLPNKLDVKRPNAARIYDYLLGGAHNLETDREFAKKLMESTPEAPNVARLNRQFLRRSVRFLAEAGVRQFLDLGSGIPTAGNVHDIAQAVDPECRVVYVDHEWVAVKHAELLLAKADNVAVAQEDLRQSVRVLDAASALLDFEEPIAVLLYAVLHFVPDSDDPWQIVAAYRDATTPGSYLAISHVTDRVVEAERLYRQSTTALTMRDRATVTGFFDGYDLLEPGVVYLPEWRPDDPSDVPEQPELADLYAAVGRKR